jgi:hypothetical protein
MDYFKIYNSLIERARVRIAPEGYIEHHHIIPKCIGGLDEKFNLVALTPEEHFVCHILLVKMYPEHKTLILAVNKMCRGHKGKRNRKLYGWLKRKFQEAQSIRNLGSGNPQYGKIWINKDGEKPKMISKDQPIPIDWSLGRRKWHKTSTTGTIWINNGKDNKLIRGSESIPEGWIRGRIMIKMGKKTA